MGISISSPPKSTCDRPPPPNTLVTEAVTIVSACNRSLRPSGKGPATLVLVDELYE